MEPYALYKHRSARFLAEISLEEKNWDEAERYIKTYQKEFPYSHFCGNEWEAYDIYNATIDARLQEGRGNVKQAIADLAPYIFGNSFASTSDVVSLMKEILKRNYSKDELTTHLREAVESIQVKRIKGNDNFVMSLFNNEINLSYALWVPFPEKQPETREEFQEKVRQNDVFVAFLGN